MQAKYAPCKWIKSIVKYTNKYNFGDSKYTQSILANLVMGHPKMKGVSFGLKGEYEIDKKKMKGIEFSKRFDLEKS